jgi:integrase
MQRGMYLEPTKVTVGQMLEQWLEHSKQRVSPKSHERYSEIVRKNIVPLLGALPLSKLRPVDISSSYAKALAGGRRDGSGGPSPGTVHYMHRLLKQALGQAVRWQLLARNPTEALSGPKVERSALNTYDVAQTAELLDVTRETRLHVPVMLAVLCGLRRGEIAALRWRNVDLVSGQLSIVQSAEQTRSGVRYKEPKSGRARTVALSSLVVEALRAHKARQAEEMLRLGVPQSGATVVYGREDGEPVQPRSLSHAWQQMLARSRLPRIRFHDLRHAHATHLLASGVHPKVASERLGHSKVGITLDLYSHVLPGMQADAAARVDDVVRAALQRRLSAIIG